MELVHAYNQIEVYYKRILKAETTTTRKRNYENICDIIKECPEVGQYWLVDERMLYYRDKVSHIKLYDQREVNKKNTVKMCEGFCSYIVHLKTQGQLKVGKTNNFNRRLGELSRDYGVVIPLQIFPFEDDEDASMMEIALKKYYKRMFWLDYIPQDRFTFSAPTAKDIEAFERMATKIRNGNMI